MGKEKIKRFDYSLWPVFGFWNIRKSFLGSGASKSIFNIFFPYFVITKTWSAGFTIVELILAMGVLAILLTGALYTLNPIEQLNKAFDAQKRSELRELKTAMDSYYNDFKCYPLKNSFDSFSGKDWKIGTIMYMKKVPKDLTYVTDYMMVTPTPGVIYCPQWYFFGIKKRSAGVSPGTGSDCPLEGSSCMPQKAVVTGTPGQLNPSDYICSYGGDVTSNNCSSLHGQIIP